MSTLHVKKVTSNPVEYKAVQVRRSNAVDVMAVIRAHKLTVIPVTKNDPLADIPSEEITYDFCFAFETDRKDGGYTLAVTEGDYVIWDENVIYNINEAQLAMGYEVQNHGFRVDVP